MTELELLHADDIHSCVCVCVVYHNSIVRSYHPTLGHADRTRTHKRTRNVLRTGGTVRLTNNRTTYAINNRKHTQLITNESSHTRNAIRRYATRPGYSLARVCYCVYVTMCIRAAQPDRDRVCACVAIAVSVNTARKRRRLRPCRRGRAAVLPVRGAMWRRAVACGLLATPRTHIQNTVRVLFNGMNGGCECASLCYPML